MIEIADDDIYFLKSDKQNRQNRKIDGPRTIYKVKKIDKINIRFANNTDKIHIVNVTSQDWLFFNNELERTDNQ